MTLIVVKTIKVKLHPNNKQLTKMFLFANASRFAYNWTLAEEIENFKQNGKFISDGDLRKKFTQLKKEKEFQWLNDISNNVTKQAIKDCCLAYKRFFAKQKENGYVKYTKKKIQKANRLNKSLTVYDMQHHPKFKRKKDTIPSFYIDTYKIKFTSTHVKVEGFSTSKRKNKQKLNWIKLAEKDKIPFGDNIKYYNPRVKFDGINWYLTIGIEENIQPKSCENQGIGIDLGIKDLAICSNGITYKNINKNSKVKKLEKKRRRLQCQISRRYNMSKKGGCYCKTSNIIKSEKELLKLNHRLTNIRHEYQLQVINDIIKRKPSFITIEDLNIQGMMKNKHLSKAIQQQALYNFIRILTYKCAWNGIELRQVNRFYPSSKLCHECGYIKKDLKLSDRTYICPKCGNVIDRDYQASLNLRDAKEYKIIA